ncbi:MAG: protein kinase [Deltaproteobacteria bacterium]|nr:protein kinase [Deltaproteobacteria bacterium]
MKNCPACGLLYPDESTFCFLDGQTLRQNDDALVGATLDGLVRAEAPVARTGWSRTYFARTRLVSRPCVAKLLELGPSADAFPDMLVAARRTAHHNVLPVLAARRFGGNALVVRPAVEAQPLSVLIQRARLDASQAAGLALQILAGLSRIHEFGGVHGNLRPTNALYWSNGHLDLIDVGFGRSLVREPWEDQPDSLVAQHYLAPELNNHQRSSQQADVYAAGVVAFELLTGTRPFSAYDVRSLRAQLGDESTANLEAALTAIPGPIARWTLSTLARVPEQRPDGATHARELLVKACREAGVAPMLDPGRPELPRAMDLDRGLARWGRYREVFHRMLAAAHPGGAPDPVRQLLATIDERVERHGGLAKRAAFEQGNHDDAHTRAGTGRERLAGQIGQVAAGADAIRHAIAGHKTEAAARGERLTSFPAEALALHKEVVLWEGRSGFTEPYRELADAYRGLADHVMTWFEARQFQLEAERSADEEREKLHAIETEVDEIRKALRVHESNAGGELDASEETLANLGREAEQLEQELLDLASRFTAPLRSKPELGPLFRELLSG